MLTASCKRDMAEHLLAIKRGWLVDHVESHGDEPISDDIMLACPGVQEALDALEWDGQELFDMTPYEVDDIKDELRDARDYPDQVRRDYARAVGL